MKRFGECMLACTLLVALLSCHLQAAEAEAASKATKQPTRLGKAFSHQIDGTQGHSVAAAASVQPSAYRGKIEKPAGYQVTEHMSQSYSGPAHSTYPGAVGDSIQQKPQDSYQSQDSYSSQSSYNAQDSYSTKSSYNAHNSYNANPGYPSRVPQDQTGQQYKGSNVYSVVPGADQLGRYHQSGYSIKSPPQEYAGAQYPAARAGSNHGMYGSNPGGSYAAGSYKNNPAAGSYGSMPYAQPAPYSQQPGAGYHSGPQDRESYTLTQPKESYSNSYQTTGAAYAPHSSYGKRSEYSDAAAMDPSRGYAEPQQQPVRGYKKAAADGTESKAQPKAAAKQHHPTVVHQDDPYRQQQLQQQQVLNALSNPNALGNVVLGNVALSNALLGNAALGNAGLGNAMLGNAVLGNAGVGNSLLANAALGSSGYGGANKQPNNPAGYSTSKVADSEAQLWWKDHQQVQQQQQSGQKQSTALDKLDALVSIINKLQN